jgi:hypothetical protein
LLSAYRWHVSQGVIDTACQAYGWPRLMARTIETATQKVNTEHTQFQRNLKGNSVQLQADIDEYSKQVTKFSQLTDVTEQIEHAALGAQLMSSLHAAVDCSLCINSEEQLFELPKSEWPRIGQLQKELQPHLDLWVRMSSTSLQESLSLPESHSVLPPT